MALLALPRFAVFQSESHHTYLCYIPNDNELHGTLQFTGEEMGSPYAKFEIERAKSTTAAGNDNGFVHIRSCYNNKYWMATSSSDTRIVAGADEPNEDQSLWSCTLFKPIRIDGEELSTRSTITTIRAQFSHVQLGFYLDSANLIGLFADESPDHQGNFIFHIHNWETLLILPKHIALKGDNGLYLSARSIHGRQYLQFASSDNGDPTVGNEVFITKYGNVRIKNNHSGKFWRLSPNWIWPDSDDTTTNDSDTLFSPVKVGDNVIALRCMVNKSFCMRISEEGRENCLNAGVQTLCREARLVVEELVISREIYNVYYRRLAARICNKNLITMVTKSVTNHTQVADTAKLKFLYKETKSSTWNVSRSLKLGVQTNFTVGIPFIVDGKIEVSAEFTKGRQWGETVSTENQVETEDTFTVPPMSKVTVSLLVRQGSCNVPFSYTQRDTLMNGNTDTLHFDDGVYTGVNNFNFEYDITTEKL